MKSLHHSFDIDLAAEYGTHEAILIHHFQHWIGENQRLKRNFINDRTWSNQTLEEIAAHFTYFTPDQVRDILYKLEHGKARKGKHQVFKPVLVKGNYNKKKHDRTVWYAFVDEKKFMELI